MSQRKEHKDRERPRPKTRKDRARKPPAKEHRPRVTSVVFSQPKKVVVKAVVAQINQHPPPWAIPSTTRANTLIVSMMASTMFAIALVAQYVLEVDMLAYVPYAVGQGLVGWGGYFLSRLSHWESPFPKVYKTFDTNNTLLWIVVGLLGVVIITFVTYNYVQLTANTFLVGAYIVLAGSTESQFFHIAIVDVGATLGRLISKSRIGEIIGKILTIPGSSLLFMSIHTEYMNNPVALLTVFAVGTYFCIIYAISGNADAILWVHMGWNLLMVLKFTF